MRIFLICLFILCLCFTSIIYAGIIYAGVKMDTLTAIEHDEQVLKNLQTFIEKNPSVLEEYKADMDILIKEALSFLEDLKSSINTKQPEGELRAYYQLSIVTISFITNIASEYGLRYENNAWRVSTEEEKLDREERIRKEAEELWKL